MWLDLFFITILFDRNLLWRVLALLRHNIRPVFVADGKFCPAAKAEELRKRQMRAKMAGSSPSSRPSTSQKVHTYHDFPCICHQNIHSYLLRCSIVMIIILLSLANHLYVVFSASLILKPLKLLFFALQVDRPRHHRETIERSGPAFQRTVDEVSSEIIRYINIKL